MTIVGQTVAVISEPNRATTDDRQLSLVIADDSAVHRLAMTAMLERAGFVVHAAADGAEAVALVREVQPDAFIVDAIMPVMSGFEAIEEVRRIPSFASLPTIVVSGLEDVASRVRALSIGANDFVCKPVDAEELVARITAQLRQRLAAAGQASVATRERNGWLDAVIDGRQFDVHYEPIVELPSGRLHGHEALVRFHDGTSPTDVFHTAGLADRRIDLELAIIEAVIDRSDDVPPELMLHVNISPAAATTDRIVDLLTASCRPIVLEITENEEFGPSEAAALRARLPPGHLIAADDVGAGFAGLVQLVGVRPDIIKIDRAIVAGIDSDPARQVVVSGLVQFAVTTSAKLIAEGIETPGEASTLTDLGVPLAQGYYFGRPTPLFSSRSDQPVADGVG